MTPRFRRATTYVDQLFRDGETGGAAIGRPAKLKSHARGARNPDPGAGFDSCDSRGGGSGSTGLFGVKADGGDERTKFEKRESEQKLFTISPSMVPGGAT
jgi:hypothetical protein